MLQCAEEFSRFFSDLPLLQALRRTAQLCRLCVDPLVQDLRMLTLQQIR
jgi:hypothetical protein